MASMSGELSYGAVGRTRPGDEAWSEHPTGYRRHAVTISIGHGQRCWDEAAEAVLEWQIKTRSGFAVKSLTNGVRVRENAGYELIALTRASRGRWRWVFPILLVAQKYYRRGYQRALQSR
jgi:uncharacterized protein (UPF0548 family)